MHEVSSITQESLKDLQKLQQLYLSILGGLRLYYTKHWCRQMIKTTHLLKNYAVDHMLKMPSNNSNSLLPVQAEVHE